MQGLHLTADLRHCCCDPRWLTESALLGPACIEAVRAVGLTPVGQLVHSFESTAHGPGGVTATVLLAESHLCVHTWPEQRAATLDVYVCNFSGDRSTAAEQLLAALLSLFEPEHVERHALRRGGFRELVP